MIAARLAVARPIARTIKWYALAASGIPALWVVWRTASDPYGSAQGAALALRVAALSLGIGVAFVLDDPTEDLTGPAPVSLLARRAVRVGLTLPLATVVWLLLLRIANGAPYMPAPLPAGAMLVEFGAFASLALGGAALGSRRLADGLGGPAGAGAVMLSSVPGMVLPLGHPLAGLVPGTELYARSQGWWWLVLGLGIGAFAAWSTTPGTLRLLRRPARARHHDLRGGTRR